MRYKMVMHTLPKAALPFLILCSVLALSQEPARGERQSTAIIGSQSESSQSSTKDASPVMLTPTQLESLLPATVYFRGKTAPIQLRNAAGARFGSDGYVLAVAVDTSGYASSVQETYQIYFITETALLIGGHSVSPGAYGAGVVNGKFLLMDVGGHMILQEDAALDQVMPRPRPLQLVINPPGGLKLYLGRNWITISAVTVK